MKNIKVKDVNVPLHFMQTGCKRNKVDEAKRFIVKNRKFSKPITVNRNNILIDGFSRFLAAKELGIQDIPCLVKEEFIYGKFPDSDKLYLWHNADFIPLRVGGRAVVENKDGEEVVTIVKIICVPLNPNYPPRKKVLRRA